MSVGFTEPSQPSRTQEVAGCLNSALCVQTLFWFLIISSSIHIFPAGFLPHSVSNYSISFYLPLSLHCPRLCLIQSKAFTEWRIIYFLMGISVVLCVLFVLHRHLKNLPRPHGLKSAGAPVPMFRVVWCTTCASKVLLWLPSLVPSPSVCAAGEGLLHF